MIDGMIRISTNDTVITRQTMLCYLVRTYRQEATNCYLCVSFRIFMAINLPCDKYDLLRLRTIPFDFQISPVQRNSKLLSRRCPKELVCALFR